MDSEKMFDQGLSIRKEVLGEAYVEASFRRADEFQRPLMELVTRYCWGEIWGRDGLPRETRSLINVALLTALNRPHELKTHVRGALNNGCTRAQIQEVLLQATVYCGVPAGVEGFKAAREAFAEMEKETSDK
jgi:4-carboxymuconolactone decarboxylase